jgi:glycosyltransferase involved in cell wall biosynthesis
MQTFLKAYEDEDTFSVEATVPPESDLPGVTIVTPTKDRLKFMELCAGCIESQCYPKDKLEWIIIDDGKDTCEELVKHIPFAKHVIEMSGKSIAWKRNRGAELASFPVIVHVDDDDIYPPNSILFRVSMMLRAKKQAVFCTTLPSYDIANYISFVNVPPMRLPQSMRVSEATMAYTKQFWEEHKFDDEVKIAEGNTFIQGREHMCSELSPQEIIVSLVHPKTTSSRRAPKGMEPNGCHYGFTDEFFTYLSDL